MNIVIDDLLYTYLEGNNFESLSANDSFMFKNGGIKSDDAYYFNWGENLHGTKHSVMETGFFYNAMHIDKCGLYNFSSFNLNGTQKIIDEFIPKIPARTLYKQGKLSAKFIQPSHNIDWKGVVLMLQHPSDRSILKAGNTKDYYNFINDACKYYGKSLLLKVHPVNSLEIENTIKKIAEPYNSTVMRVSMDVIDQCEYVVVYNSTAVIDSLLKCKRVLQYAPGYFWRSNVVDFSNNMFREPVNINLDYTSQFCSFLAWKYCFHTKIGNEKMSQIFRSFAASKELFPLPEELSYASTVMSITPSHLGGHANITHIDENVLEHFIKELKCNSFLDIGCGPGGMVKLAKEKGLHATGIDGDTSVKSEIVHDFTQDKIHLDRTYDIGWSVEFVNHIKPEYIDNIFSAFKQCKYIVMTHALPGKTGHHHVNCQIPSYWVEQFQSRGFRYDNDLTTVVRRITSMKREFMRMTGMVFINSELK
jgi:hypothetical protein